MNDTKRQFAIALTSGMEVIEHNGVPVSRRCTVRLGDVVGLFVGEVQAAGAVEPLFR